MKTLETLALVLSCVSTAASWTTTNYWLTRTVTTNLKTPTVTSVAVFPTGAVSPTESKTSTSLFTSVGYTLKLTVFDLFLAPSAAVCTLSRLNCGPPVVTHTTGIITTTYWAPVPISNPSSCTETSFSYTAASTILLPSVWIRDAATQATQSENAQLVTTTVKTISTNMGGQEVTTTVCDVYLRSEGVFGVTYVAESTLLTECVNPRVYSCSSLSSALAAGAGIVGAQTTCVDPNLGYPPTGIAAAAGPGPTTDSSDPTKAAGAPSPTKSSGAEALGVSAIAVGGALAAVVGWLA
ncbi:hypothetical protein B0T24DRAFT_143897 [Lasiosphaeria ovina]|uniref:Uncharacterized protein n=1 Tax=Lasiosphaeria ovina TaxID=92902 RepID=A0AAE0NDI0_9PEZI|nr:hypothetical protein B0T24DRAFT_143897 [Lasiosphaeria ovina]